MGETTVPSGRLSMLRVMRRVSWGVRFSVLWLTAVAIVGLLAPLLSRSGGGPGGWATDFGPFERPRIIGQARLSPGTGMPPHVLGTDGIGQDVLANLVHACRSALLVGVAGAGTALLIGITLGALMGYFGGWVDLLLMRVVEVFMSVPLLFLLVLGAAVLPQEPIVIMALIGAVTWTGVARLTRAEVMRVRSMDFVDAARASGLPARRVIFNHVLPSAVSPALVEAAFLFAAAILFEATLSFLNLGPVDRASWGRLLAQATGDSGEFAWWLAVFPGVMIVLTVLSAQTLGAVGREARQSSRSIV